MPGPLGASFRTASIGRNPGESFITLPQYLPPVASTSKIVRGAALQARIKDAHERVRSLVQHPMVQGKICVLGLSVLQVLRATAWSQNMHPALPVVGMHCLSTASDVGCMLCATPLFICGTEGTCVQWTCLGPLVTMLFSLCLVDIGGLAAYFYMSPQRPIAPGFVTFLDRIMAAVSVWEAVLVASVALQMALMAVCWRIYAEMRLAGLYPPGNNSIAKGETVSHVSVLEVVCEAEDVALLTECSAAPPVVGAGDELRPQSQRYPSSHLSEVPAKMDVWL